jgi:hypothetical protein
MNCSSLLLEHQGKQPHAAIPQDEIDAPGAYGVLDVFGRKGERPEMIALALQAFVSQNI